MQSKTKENEEPTRKARAVEEQELGRQEQTQETTPIINSLGLKLRCTYTFKQP